jgi:hypothetical protein
LHLPTPSHKQKVTPQEIENESWADDEKNTVRLLQSFILIMDFKSINKFVPQFWGVKMSELMS